MLWCFHSIRHSAGHPYFLANSRAHPVDFVFVRLCGLTPLYILSLASPLSASGSPVPVLIVLVATVCGFFVRANLRWRLGRLEWVISTPAFHHWSHTRPESRGRNYASILPWMDRIFGTHYLPRNQWPSGYGCEEKVPASLGAKRMHPLVPKAPQVRFAEPVVTDPQ